MSDSQTEKKVRKALPFWSKLLILLVLMTFVGSIYGIVLGTVAFKKAFEHSEDPTHIAEIAQSIAQFPSPLPKGYKYIFGVDMDFISSVKMKIVSIDFENGKQQLLLLVLNQKRKTKEMLVDAYKIGINTPAVSGHFKEVISRGSWTIQNRPMPYIIGKVKSTDGKEHIGLVSCLVLAKKDKTLLLYAVQPGETKKFDLSICVGLLKEISGF